MREREGGGRESGRKMREEGMQGGREGGREGEREREEERGATVPKAPVPMPMQLYDITFT